MVWTYKQSTGELFHNGKHIETGYSGRMTNKNKPDREQVKGLGPIPRGRWHIGTITTHKGPLTIKLEQHAACFVCMAREHMVFPAGPQKVASS